MAWSYIEKEARVICVCVCVSVLVLLCSEDFNTGHVLIQALINLLRPETLFICIFLNFSFHKVPAMQS